MKPEIPPPTPFKGKIRTCFREICPGVRVATLEEVPDDATRRTRSLPLVGGVIETIVIPAYEASSFAEAVRQANFDNKDLAESIACSKFRKERVGLARPTKVDLVRFNREWLNDEAIAWDVKNGQKPMETAHLMGIAIKLPDVQRKVQILGLDCTQLGLVLMLDGDFNSRVLYDDDTEEYRIQDSLVGFINE